MKGLLLSGGMDSIAVAWWKRPDVALTIDYGQRPARAEIAASSAICHALGVRHEIVRVDCSHLGSGDMAGEPPLAVAPVSEWWPYRNQLLITLAAMAGIRIGLLELMIGTLASDGVHADGTREFVAGISNLLSLQEGGMILSAPAQHLTAVDLIRVSGVPRDVLAWAHSCHTGNVACGSCRGCVKHFQTYEALGDEPY